MEPFRTKYLLPYIDVFLLGESTKHFDLDSEKKCILGLDLERTLALLKSAKVVFCHPNDFDTWTDILIELAPKQFPIRLFIFSGSDYTLDTDHIEAMAAFYPRTKFWIQNWVGTHPAVTTIHIGVNIFTHVNVEREHIFCISSVTVNSIEREVFKEFVLAHPEIQRFMAPRLELEDFCHLLKSHYFSFCPQGNGFDSFRVWESLACGAIPIMKESPFTKVLYTQYPKLPIIYIKEYSDLFTLIPALSKEMYEEIMSEADISIVGCDYWVNKIITLRDAL